MVRTNFFLASVLVLLAGCNQEAARPLTLVERSAEVTAESEVIVSEDAIRSDVFFLASQRLEGRGVGTQGLDIAGDYIATRFRALGLKPLPGMKDYFQPFLMTVSQSVDAATRLASGEKKYVLNRDFTAATFSANQEFEGDLVFAGYGISDKDRKYDDYDNLDVKDKVVLVLRYEPHDDKGKSKWTDNGDVTNNASLETKARVAFERGAKAVIIVNPPKWHDTGSDPFFSRSSGSFEKIPLLHVKRTVAEEWLKRGGAADLMTLMDQIDTGGKPVTAQLKGVRVSGNVKINRRRETVRNVMAYIPGSGPTANEFVIVGAHYDHLGSGAQGGSLANIARMIQGGATQPATNPVGKIHFGADDNASGTAALLELARLFSKQPGPARSLVFIAFTAEESGLMGSGHFVKNSPIDLKKVAVMLNLDMVGRVRNNRVLIGGHGTAQPLDAIMKKIDDRSPLTFVDNGKGGLGPSDHMSFALAKVPVIFLFSNTHPDYHMPTDTADKVNFDGIEHVVAASVPMVGEFVRMPMSKYIDAADRFSMRGAPSTQRSEGVRRASLGVIPKYGGEEDGKGVPIGGATEGTAAAKAGLVDGDVLVGLGKHTIGTLAELSAALAAQRPGDKVKLKWMRGGKAMEAEVELGERR